MTDEEMTISSLRTVVAKLEAEAKGNYMRECEAKRERDKYRALAISLAEVYALGRI